jgi:hypothetical protein
MFERDASGDDLVPCPNCGTESELRVRFHVKQSGIGHDQTDVFCPGCGQIFSASETRWAYADWNAWAIDAWQRKGKHIDIAPLYCLLKEEADFQRDQEVREHDLERRISASLEQYVDCPWNLGDRFQSKQRPVGIWEVTKIERIYATNTGPMWLVHATKVKASGFLGGDSHVFAGRDADQLEAIAPFWRPTKWTQLVVGDACLHDLESGTLIAVDAIRHQTRIKLAGGNQVEIDTLKPLKVPVARFTKHAT